PTRQISDLSLVWGVVVFNGSCLYAIYRALRTRAPQHLLLGAACVAMVVVAVHDIDVALRQWDNDQTWSYFSWPLNLLVLAVLLGWQVASHMRRVDGFNVELTAHVAQARAELAQVLAQQHAKDLQSAKLHERMQLAHDLHDGLGGSLVRSMALVEQAPQQLSNERVMSLLKTLRDDLRQVIDTGSSAGVTVPDTPGQWLAPLRHRFMRILDEVGMQGQWHMPAHWQQRPSALQCLGLIRFLEEAFANVLKHSQARRMQVRCWQPTPDTLALSVEDDGLGFDVPAVLQAGMSVGMRSMQARMVRIGGRLEVQSAPGCTRLTAWVQLADGSVETGAGTQAAAGDFAQRASV
ncbi:MAG: histidine kinase, partial [Comamonas sp.]